MFRVNNQIQAKNLRVVGSDGKQIGVMSRSEALEKALKENSDLIEIAPKATPPVAKIMDLGKFIYQEEKKKKRENKVKGGDLKEVRFSPFIAENDYKTRVERIKEFLDDKNKVRLTVVFRQNQLRSKDFGYEILRNCLRDLKGTAREDVPAKFLGRNLTMIISPAGGKAKKDETKDKENSIETPQNNQER